MKRLIVLLLLALVSSGVSAQSYPVKPVRLIVADAAGGAPDQLAPHPRAEALREARPAGHRRQPARRRRRARRGHRREAPADGYTLLLTTTAIYAILPSLSKNLPYDPVRDFVPVSRIATASNVLVVNNAAARRSPSRELVQLAKSKPGVLNYASAGVGSPAHLAGEMLNLLAGIKLTHVPYKGAAPGLLDVIAGNAQLIITSPIAAGAHMSGGRVRALATTGTERNPRLPELPTDRRHGARLRDHAVVGHRRAGRHAGGRSSRG